MARDCKKCKYFQGMHPIYENGRSLSTESPEELQLLPRKFPAVRFPAFRFPAFRFVTAGQQEGVAEDFLPAYRARERAPFLRESTSRSPRPDRMGARCDVLQDRSATRPSP